MDDQLTIDSSGAWVRKAAQLIADKPLLPLERFEALTSHVEHSYKIGSKRYEQTYIISPDD